MKQTLWDFSTPLTPVDLGSRVKDFHQPDGPLALRVTFPSGRVIEGVWER